MYKRIIQLSRAHDGIIDFIHAARYSEEFLVLDKKTFKKKICSQSPSNKFLFTFTHNASFFDKGNVENTKTGSHELERLGMNKANYGQQPCHCRLGESRFHFGFWRTRVYFLEIFTSFNLKMMTSCNKTWLTAF